MIYSPFSHLVVVLLCDPFHIYLLLLEEIRVLRFLHNDLNPCTCLSKRLIALFGEFLDLGMVLAVHTALMNKWVRPVALASNRCSSSASFSFWGEG